MMSKHKECVDGKHAYPVDAFCTVCKLPACKVCTQKLHYDHLSAIQYRGEEILNMVNFLTKLKATTSKALHINSAVVKGMSVESVAEDQEKAVRATYDQFDKFIKQHKLALLWKIRLSKYVQRLRALYDDAKAKRVRLEETHALYADRVKKLLTGELKEKFRPDLVQLSGEEELSKQQKEMESYNTLGGQIQKYSDQVKKLQQTDSKYSQEKVNLRGICQLEIPGLEGDKLVLPRKNSNEVWTYVAESRKFLAYTFPGEKFPMNFSVIEAGKLVYIIGGNRPDTVGANVFLDTVRELNLETKTSRLLSPMKNKRRRAGAVLVRDRFIYVIGGDRDNDFLDSCECYDIETDKWTDVSPLNEGKTNVSVGSFDDKELYVFGGYNKTLYDLPTIEKLSLASPAAKWEQVELSTQQYWAPLQNAGVVQIASGEMLVFGGMRVGKPLAQCLVYKVDEKKFEKCADMAGTDTFLQTKPRVFPYYVYAFGCHKNDLHIFDLKARTWQLLAQKDWRQIKP